jgi:hypothetical protein
LFGALGRFRRCLRFWFWRFNLGRQFNRFSIVGMAQAFVRLTCATSAIVATDAAVVTKRFMTDLAFAHLSGALLAKNALAINTGWRETTFMSQMTVVAQVSALDG